jgi:GDP-L-fucose synthase
VNLTNDKIFVAGHNGMVGSAVVRALEGSGAINICVADRTSLDLVDPHAVASYFSAEKPDVVVVAAAKVGGIHANDTYPADFIYQNLMIESNLIQAAHAHGCRQLLFLGSSCIYPRMAVQPITEAALLDGMLEPTNEPYGIAKIAGIKLCESYNRQYGTDFRSLMPTNLYGVGDNFHAEDGHVIPMLMRRIHEAKLKKRKQVEIWGSGTPMREFLNVDDLADACVHILMQPKSAIEAVTAPMLSHINVGTGVEISIRALAETIQEVVGFNGELVFDKSHPDGTPRKLLDVSKINTLGWRAGIPFQQGLCDTYQWFLEHIDSVRT